MNALCNWIDSIPTPEIIIILIIISIIMFYPYRREP